MDPKRLSNEGNDFEMELLHAGRRDAMPEPSARIILGALGLAPSAAAAGAVATGAKLALLKTALVVGGIGAGGAVAFIGGQHWLEDPAPVSVSSAPRLEVRVSTKPSSLSDASEPAAVPQVLEQEVPKQPAPKVRPTVKKKVDTLPLELRALDEARGALARGDHAQASRLLDRYAARFTKPRLGTEATLLRIETHVARGDRQAATRLGTAFLARNPNGPYARRVRSLIGASDAASPGSDAQSGQR